MSAKVSASRLAKFRGVNGAQRRLAFATGLSEQFISRALRHEQTVSAHSALAIEEASEGLIKAEDLSLSPKGAEMLRLVRKGKR